MQRGHGELFHGLLLVCALLDLLRWNPESLRHIHQDSNARITGNVSIFQTLCQRLFAGRDVAMEDSLGKDNRERIPLKRSSSFGAPPLVMSNFTRLQHNTPKQMETKQNLAGEGSPWI